MQCNAEDTSRLILLHNLHYWSFRDRVTTHSHLKKYKNGYSSFLEREGEKEKNLERETMDNSIDLKATTTMAVSDNHNTTTVIQTKTKEEGEVSSSTDDGDVFFFSKP
jgi:hypothetical protein